MNENITIISDYPIEHISKFSEISIEIVKNQNKIIISFYKILNYLKDKKPFYVKEVDYIFYSIDKLYPFVCLYNNSSFIEIDSNKYNNIDVNNAFDELLDTKIKVNLNNNFEIIKKYIDNNLKLIDKYLNILIK